LSSKTHTEINYVKTLTTSPIFIESYLAGREFTALITGDVSNPSSIKVYPAAERVFDESLKGNQRLLAFDRYWDGFSLEKVDGETEKKPEKIWHRYEMAPEELQMRLQGIPDPFSYTNQSLNTQSGIFCFLDVAKRAYIACYGSGYGRVDMRTTQIDSHNVQVLEVNSQCGLAFDENGSSLGEILRLCGVAPSAFVRELVRNAVDKKFAAATV
jgi:hypothetical protein